MKDFNNMTRQELLELPILDDVNPIEIDSIILLPTRQHHDSGYNYYQVVVCNNREAIGRTVLYDTFSIYMEGKYNRVGIDCLRGSGLMRIFLPSEEYVVHPYLHSITIKNKYQEGI